MQTGTNFIKSLSSHLFWDVNISLLNSEKDKKLIINRVLEYGLINDWKTLYKFYGIEQIAAVAVTLRNLDNKAMAFISVLSKTPPTSFRCYNIKPSMPKHWNF